MMEQLNLYCSSLIAQISWLHIIFVIESCILIVYEIDNGRCADQYRYKNRNCDLWILKYVYPKYNISSTTTTMMLSCCISNFNLNYRTDVMVRDMYMIMWQLKYDINQNFLPLQVSFFYFLFSLFICFSLFCPEKYCLVCRICVFEQILFWRPWTWT